MAFPVYERPTNLMQRVNLQVFLGIIVVDGFIGDKYLAPLVLQIFRTAGATNVWHRWCYNCFEPLVL